MKTNKEFLMGLIYEVSPTEVAHHIADDSLTCWLSDWKECALDALRKLEEPNDEN